MPGALDHSQRDRPLDRLDKIIPQPLKAEGDVHVHIDLPTEARLLMRDLHEDRAMIGVGFLIILLLLAAAVGKYVCDWRRKG